jgi:hypothetical protein
MISSNAVAMQKSLRERGHIMSLRSAKVYTDRMQVLARGLLTLASLVGDGHTLVTAMSLLTCGSFSMLQIILSRLSSRPSVPRLAILQSIAA